MKYREKWAKEAGKSAAGVLSAKCSPQEAYTLGYADGFNKALVKASGMLSVARPNDLIMENAALLVGSIGSGEVPTEESNG